MGSTAFQIDRYYRPGIPPVQFVYRGQKYYLHRYEVTILKWLAEDKSYKEIATLLNDQSKSMYKINNIIQRALTRIREETGFEERGLPLACKIVYAFGIIKL